MVIGFVRLASSRLRHITITQTSIKNGMLQANCCVYMHDFIEEIAVFCQKMRLFRIGMTLNCGRLGA